MLITLSMAFASAANLALPADRFWAVLASRQDPDAAIAAARTHPDMHPQVTRAVNGWYAVVAGPYDVKPGTGRAFLDRLVKEHNAPKDTLLSRGASFDGVTWTEPATNVSGTLEYDGEHDLTAVKGDLTLTFSRKADGDGQFHPTLDVAYKGRKAVALTIADNSSEKPASKVDLVRLDPSSPLPQVVFTYFWQGAHCCTVTKVASLGADGVWRVIDAGALDGGGYAYEDMTGAGFSHLVSVDNGFLYAFDSYADSYAPIRIQKLVGGTLTDVTCDPDLRHRVLQDLYRMQGFADADARRAHGYLAGWVADSILAGRGQDAWRTMLASYNREDSMFGPEACSTGAPVEKCPEDRKVKLPFPVGLKQMLGERGYMPDPADYPVPREASIAPARTDTAPPDAAPQLRTCAAAAGTVRRLVYQTFAGRNLRPGEDDASVVVSDDATLEDYDPVLRKVTCAVDYTMALRPLIGRLAEEGNLARASSLGQLSRRSGGSVSHRVKFTVKPTAAAGTEYVELLP